MSALIQDKHCLNERYRVIVQPYLLGQFRLQLIDRSRRHGDNIVRELCTYHRSVMDATVEALCAADDPAALCETLAKPWNCEMPGGRIRLDNRPESKRGLA